jgi:hypothetical protein
MPVSAKNVTALAICPPPPWDVNKNMVIQGQHDVTFVNSDQAAHEIAIMVSIADSDGHKNQSREIFHVPPRPPGVPPIEAPFTAVSHLTVLYSTPKEVVVTAQTETLGAKS